MTDKTVLNQKQAAELRGVTPRCLGQLETEGDNPPPRNLDGKYPALEYGDWLKNQYTSSRFAYAKEKARLTHYQANEKELQVKAFKRELLPYDEVVDHWTMLLRNARAVILTIPGRVANISSATNRPRVEEEIRSIVYGALEELASGDGTPKPKCEPRHTMSRYPPLGFPEP